MEEEEELECQAGHEDSLRLRKFHFLTPFFQKKTTKTRRKKKGRKEVGELGVMEVGGFSFWIGGVVGLDVVV